jgi:hypothetical protein
MQTVLHPAESDPALNTSHLNSRLIGVLLVVLGTWFLAGYFHKVANATLFFDCAWHATVAKNAVWGPGYASSYNGYSYFDPDVTTGPVPIGLAAAAIAVFGNQYSLPLYVASLLHLCLALAVICGVFRVAGRSSAIAFAIALALLLSYFEPSWWQMLTGDMSSLLWGILGLQLTVQGMDGGRRGALLGAGCMLGLSLLSKSVGVVFLAASGAYVLWTGFRHRKMESRALLTLVVGFLICLLPWQLYQATTEVPTADPDRVVASSALTRKVVGVVQLWEARDKTAHIRQSVAISNALFSQKLGQYGLPAFSHLLLLLSSLALLVYALQGPNGQRDHLLLALALATVGYWAWHFLLCVSLDLKYTLYPLFMSVVLVLYWLCTTRLRWVAPLLLIVWMLSGPATARDEALRFYSFGSVPDAYRSDLVAVAAAVENIAEDPSTPPLAACGWMTMPWPLEYVLPGSNYFMDCYQHLARAMVRDSQTGTYRWRSDIDLSFILVVDESLWSFDLLNSDKNAIMLEICGGNQLYRNNFYRILECRDADLRSGIDPLADSLFHELRRPGE